MLATLRQRDFALVWVSGLVSFVGDRMLIVALPYFVYQQTGSTLATAAITVAEILPDVLLSSLAGVFADRWDRKWTMVVGNLLQMLAVLLLLLVQIDGLLWVVYLAALLQSAIGSFVAPAENALLPRLVDEQHLLSANALNSLNNNLARLIGPPLGGALLAYFGLGAVVVVDSLSFLIAALLVASIFVSGKPSREEFQVEQARPGEGWWANFWREWADGLTLIRRDRLIVTLMLVLGIMTFGGTMMSPLYPPFAGDVLRVGAQGLGLMMTAQAVGGILGGLVIARLGVVLPTARILAWGNILVGLLLLLQFNVPLFAVALLVALLIGPEQVAAGSALQTLLQKSVPDAYKGRVFGAMGTTGALLSVLGAGAAGPLGETLGVVPAMNIAAGLTIFAGLVALARLPKTDT